MTIKERVEKALSSTNWMTALDIYREVRSTRTTFLSELRGPSLGSIWNALESLEKEGLVESSKRLAANPLTQKPYMRPVFRKVVGGKRVELPITSDRADPLPTGELIPKPV